MLQWTLIVLNVWSFLLLQWTPITLNVLAKDWSILPVEWSLIIWNVLGNDMVYFAATVDSTNTECANCKRHGLFGC